MMKPFKCPEKYKDVTNIHVLSILISVNILP